MTHRSRGGLAVIAVVIAAGVVEAYVLFAQREGAFRIVGREPYRVQEFSEGQTVSQAFMMLGNGLKQVEVQVVSDAAASGNVRWTLYRGSRDEPPLVPVARGDESVRLAANRPLWLTLPVIRDGSSHDRWYTLELQLLGPESRTRQRPRVAVMATSDNPDRGGVLWVGDKRQPGSLMMRARWESVTVYRRFVTEGVPHLPRPLRQPAVQALLLVAVHWAFTVYALTLVRAAEEFESVDVPVRDQ
ncbi:MAG TPA: hypothetical protein VEC39_18410 [Vicinamibacterales bacterium]|nr:hypothetical protein [Vicinamibacterales bacterium]